MRESRNGKDMTDNQDMKERLQEISRGLFLKLFDEDFNLTVSIGEAFDFTEKALLEFAEEQGRLLEKQQSGNVLRLLMLVTSMELSIWPKRKFWIFSRTNLQRQRKLETCN